MTELLEILRRLRRGGAMRVVDLVDLDRAIVLVEARPGARLLAWLAADKWRRQSCEMAADGDGWFWETWEAAGRCGPAGCGATPAGALADLERQLPEVP